MNADEMKFYLEKLSDILAGQEIKGEIVLYGGAVMVLAFQARPATKDIDAVFLPKDLLYKAAKEIEEVYGAPKNWLNDAVKGFVSPREEIEPFMDFSHLKVYVASPRYLLAMKCISMRLGRGERDVQDIRYLMEYLGLKTIRDVLDLVENYYPRNRISPKTQFAIEELFEILNKQK